MRETHITQVSIFENYSKYEFGAQLWALSNRLDQHPEILLLVADDLIDTSVTKVGRTGLTVENIFRCMLLKQQLRISYEQLVLVSWRTTNCFFNKIWAPVITREKLSDGSIQSVRTNLIDKATENCDN